MKIEINLTDEILEAIADKVAKKTNKTAVEVPEVDRIYTAKEVAEITGKTQQTINIHIKKGLLKATKTGKSNTITQTNLNNYINGN